MATSTTSDTARAAALFHALSDPIRLGVIELLQDGEHCVCDLTGALSVAQSRLSWHLKTLAEAEMIVGRRQGRWVYYSLNIDRVREAQGYLDSIRVSARAAKRRIQCCE